MFFGDAPMGAVDASLPDGKYIVAIRAHHLSLNDALPGAVALNVVVGSSEITGSETFIHINAADQPWVLLTHGVHQIESGSSLKIYLDPSRYYLFDSEGSLVRAPDRQSQAA